MRKDPTTAQRTLRRNVRSGPERLSRLRIWTGAAARQSYDYLGKRARLGIDVDLAAMLFLRAG